jgi:hypothetical protein
MFKRDAKSLTYVYLDASQNRKYGFATKYFPPIDAHEEWEYFRNNLGVRKRSAHDCIVLYSIMKSIGRKEDANFLRTQIENAILEIIKRCPAACARTAKNDKIKNFARRNRDALVKLIYAEIAESCLEISLDETNNQHTLMRNAFRKTMRRKSIDSLRKITRSYDNLNKAKSRACKFSYIMSVEFGSHIEYGSEMQYGKYIELLRYLREKITSDKLRQAYKGLFQRMFR